MFYHLNHASTPPANIYMYLILSSLLCRVEEKNRKIHISLLNFTLEKEKYLNRFKRYSV
jgi:hypothetical protein